MENRLATIALLIVFSVALLSSESGAVVVTPNVVSTVAGQAMTAGTTDGIGTVAQFGLAGKIATDGANLYLSDTYNNTIRKITISTGAVTTLAGTPGTVGSSDGTGSTALFNSPQGIATDGTNLYIADSMNRTIRKIVIATGKVTTLAGTVGLFGSNDGIGPAAQFVTPCGVATDGTNLFITDSFSGTIRKLVLATGAVTTLAGNAQVKGFADGTGAAAGFTYPTGITSDGNNLYVIDLKNNIIRKIVISTGQVTTVAGTVGVQGFKNGNGTSVLFALPQDIATDGTNLYVSDAANLVIRNMNLATGEVSTLTGTNNTPGYLDGDGISAKFLWPGGLALGGSSLYVMDDGVVRQIQ
jgi:hypothetical protein